MAAKNASKPRQNKNSDGQNKRPKPTMSHDISITPGEPPESPPPPGAPQPGATNPMTHPNHPAMQSSLAPGTAPPGPTKGPQDNRQVQERIQFKDLNPAEQSQVAQQQGINPYAPLQMVQQGVEGALQQGPSSGPIPNMLSGPYVPPGVESFPDDMAHLTTLMGQGYAPGASAQEHEYGQNAHAMARAKINAAMAQAQRGAGAPTMAPPAAPPAPPAAPPGVTLAPGIPQMGSSMAPQPPQAPGAPGGVPPELIAALMAQHKKQRPTG